MADKKNRPTPKRAEQEAARRRSLLDNSKEMKKARQKKIQELRNKEYQAMQTGDINNMPRDHRGPEKAFIRDYIDARWTIMEFLLPLSILFIIVSMILTSPQTQHLAAFSVLAFYIILLISIFELVLVMRGLKKQLVKRFGETLPRGWRFYTITRSFMVRRFRLPKARVKRGEYPV